MVSSTFADLKELRRILVDAAQAAHLFPEAMEHDAARPIDLIESSLEKVRAASAYVLVIAHRYGQRPESAELNPRNVSITELEFDEAVRLGLPILLFLLSENYPLPPKHVDRSTRLVAKLNAFRDRAKSIDGKGGLHRVWVAVESETEFRQNAERSMQRLARWLADQEGATAARRGLSEAIDAERERLSRAVVSGNAASRQRVVNLAPQALAELFKDRTGIATALCDALLAGSARLVTLFGPGGIGKTALACQVLHRLESEDAVHGIIYLNPQTTGTTFERIYSDSGRMLGGAAEQKLAAAWRSEASTTASKIQLLLEAFGTKRCIILLDNLESVLDVSGRPVEGDLQALLASFLAQEHGARLFATTREPLNLSAELRKYQKLIPLEQGLPVPEAVALLRELDQERANGDLGLQDAPEPLLILAAEKTLGYPTALEAIFGILSENKQLSLSALLADDALFHKSVIRNLVQSALSLLDAHGHQVMQALAAFGRPVREVAVAHLLEQHLDAQIVHDVVQRLTRSLYVNCKRATGELILHPFYREFSLAELDSEDRRALERRAAAYYARMRLPSDQWTSIRSLDPQLFEFEHRLQADDFPAGHGVLSQVDVEYLIPWGHARLVVELRGRLAVAKLPTDAQAIHEVALAEATLALGRYADAVRHASRAIELAELVDQPAVHAYADIVLGQAAWFLGDYRSQERRCRHALDWSRAAGDARTEIRARCGLADACRCLGLMSEAVEHAKEAAALAGKTGRKLDEARAQGSLGAAHRLLGDLKAARRCYEAELVIAHELADVVTICRSHNNLALVLLAAGEPANSLEYARKGLVEARQIGSVEQEAFATNYAGCALLAAGRYHDAVGQLENSLKTFEKIDYRYGVSFVLAFLGSACIGLVDLQRALRFLKRGLAVATELDEPRSAGYNHFQIARAYAAAGALDHGIVAVGAAQERFAAAGTPHVEACVSYAEALRCRGEDLREREAAALLQAAQGLLRGGDFSGEAHALAREAAALVSSDPKSPTHHDASELAARLDLQLRIPPGILQVPW
jgi:tetratricopeptide (TPR) repeat protein